MQSGLKLSHLSSMINPTPAKTYRLEGKALVADGAYYLIESPNHYRLVGPRQLRHLMDNEAIIEVDVIVYRQSDYGLLVVTFGNKDEALNIGGRQAIFDGTRLRLSPR